MLKIKFDVFSNWNDSTESWTESNYESGVIFLKSWKYDFTIFINANHISTLYLREMPFLYRNKPKVLCLTVVTVHPMEIWGLWKISEIFQNNDN